MNVDEKFIISTAKSCTSTKWARKKLSWGELADLCERFARGEETHAQYLAMSKAEQGRLKDVGGFVGGELQNGIRRRGHCGARRIITLDVDNCPAGSTEEIVGAVAALGFPYIIYSTRKHDAEHPRLRVLLPTDRAMTADEYQPVARAVAQMIDGSMAVFDRTTYEGERVMFWPSASADSETVARSSADGSPAPVDEILTTMYGDWHDASQWPQGPGEQAAVSRGVKQQDPASKRGVVGAFCRAYSIPEAMEQFLPGVYTYVDNNRYTFAGGSTTGGAVLYDNEKFLFSHHSTDPAGGHLCNAFDLVRLHKFGELDAGADVSTPSNQMPSFLKMREFAEQDTLVASALQAEREEYADHQIDGLHPLPDEADTPRAEQSDTSWTARLERNSKGVLAATTQNVRLILENDDKLKTRLWFDSFAARMRCRDPLPWTTGDGERDWGDGDDAGVRWYLELKYHFSSAGKVTDGTNLTASAHTVDPVKDYLAALEWDGIPRLDTVFIDYLGAEDCPYVRAVTRKILVAAVARTYQPGRKFDQIVVLSGPQGLGKDIILSRLGRNWYNDSITSFDGKEAREALRGVWIVELGEMTAFNKSEAEAAKQFLSQTEDRYRAAYGRRAETYPRRCVFFGTSNTSEYLRDSTGNRRYWPIDVGKHPAAFNPHDDFTDDVVGQVWAEAVVRYRAGEALLLDDELTREVSMRQNEHQESEPWAGVIADFVDRPLPLDWAQWPLERRREWWSGVFLDADKVQTEPRTAVCVAEIWQESMGRPMDQIDARASRRIGQVLSTLPGWASAKNTRRFGPYGSQKAWIKYV